MVALSVDATAEILADYWGDDLVILKVVDLVSLRVEGLETMTETKRVEEMVVH